MENKIGNEIKQKFTKINYPKKRGALIVVNNYELI